MASEEDLKRLHGIMQTEGNGYCVDCGAKDPEWASINLGVFICIECSGFHRNMGTHISKVRSLRLDIWNDETIEFMRNNGNSKSNSIFEYSVPVWYPRIKDGDQTILREQWIRAKYERKEFTKDTKPTFDIGSFPQQPVKEGTIYKKGKENSKWLPRYFVIRDKIYYFKKENDPKDLGTIELKQLKVCFASQKASKPFCLQLLDGADNRAYYVYTENAREIVSWFSALIIAKSIALGINLSTINSHEQLMEEIDILIVQEGSLSKKIPPKNNYAKRWCILDTKYIWFFKDSIAPFPLEKITLNASSSVKEANQGYQILIQSQEGEQDLECESKVDKAKWISSVDGVIKRLSEKRI